jgi:ketosteroid isomerase-like protein
VTTEIEPAATKLAIALVESFGDPEAIGNLLTEDAEWWITPTVGILGSPSVGREQIVAAMRVIFGDIYTDATAEIHAALGDDETGAVRFTLRATVGERPYINEYSVWIRRSGDRIDRVWEYLDVAEATRQIGFGSDGDAN